MATFGATSKISWQFVPVACSITAKCCFTMFDLDSTTWLIFFKHGREVFWAPNHSVTALLNLFCNYQKPCKDARARVMCSVLSVLE